MKLLMFSFAIILSESLFAADLKYNVRCIPTEPLVLVSFEDPRSHLSCVERGESGRMELSLSKKVELNIGPNKFEFHPEVDFFEHHPSCKDTLDVAKSADFQGKVFDTDTDLGFDVFLFNNSAEIVIRSGFTRCSGKLVP